MKLNNKGWGFRMMALLMGVLAIFFIIAIVLIYNYYNNISGKIKKPFVDTYMVIK